MKRETLKKENYKAQAAGMQKRVATMILAKQKSTVAMALALTNDEDLLNHIYNNKIPKGYYKKLIKNFREKTLYKNIWIQVVDKNVTSLYRSWTEKSGDSLKKVRTDLAEVLKTKKVTYTISSGKFDLTIKALVPILQGDEVKGVVEVISHFNSISKEMKKFDVDSVVLLDKKFSKRLEHPFTEIFIDEYYIANFDAPLYLRKRLKEHGVLNHFNSGFIVNDGKIATSYELKSTDGETLGWYMMFKKIKDISTVDVDFFIFKWLALGLLGVMALAGVINLTMFYFLRKQKIYYKKIIDTSTNIVIINDKKHIRDVNKVFFKYFYEYETIDDFKANHSCICDFFVNEDGYLQKDMNGINWIDYLLNENNQSKKHKVKVEYDEKIYYFFVEASIVSKKESYFSVVFTDITNEEKYKIELEVLSVTDSLTGIGNRRFFQDKLDEERYRANRYEHCLSFIMFDIDHFKKVNDEHGHGVGDSVLIEYTKLISTIIRDVDTFCRIGGEEFMIILPHTIKNDAKKLAEKLRVSVQEYKKVIPITMSFGVVEYIKGEDAEYLYKRVDEALYEAKNSGRNIVVSK